MKFFAAAGLCLLAIGVFHASTFREGHDWGGDNCQYLLHARNLAVGRNYTDIGVIHNPASLVFPVSYPPVFPALLVPVYLFFGMSLTGAKYVVLLFFLLSLAAGALLFRRSMTPAGILAWMLCVGLSPYFWEFKDHGLSEIPFLFFTLLFFLLCRVERAWGAFLSGVVLYLAYGTRAVGLLLIPSLFLYDWMKNRRLTRRPFLVLSAFLPLAFAQWAFFHNDGLYILYKLKWIKPLVLWDNLSYYYPRAYLLLWHNAVSHAAGLALGFLMFAAAIYGYAARWKKRLLEPFDVFVPLYLAVFLFIFSSDVSPYGRYLVPMFPFLIFYSVCGIEAAAAHFRRLGKWVLCAAALAVLFSYAFRYSRLDLGPIADGITGIPEREVYAFIRQHTDTDDVIAFPDPRVSAFFTGRRSAQFLMARSTQQKVNYMLRQGVKYWVSLARYRNFRHPSLKAVFHNSKYVIFELQTRSSRSSGPRNVLKRESGY